MMKKNKFKIFLRELLNYQKQGEKLNLQEFDAWKNQVSSELSGSYKIKFDQLQFYTLSEETEYDSDDVPF